MEEMPRLLTEKPALSLLFTHLGTIQQRLLNFSVKDQIANIMIVGYLSLLQLISNSAFVEYKKP